MEHIIFKDFLIQEYVDKISSMIKNKNVLPLLKIYKLFFTDVINFKEYFTQRNYKVTSKNVKLTIKNINEFCLEFNDNNIFIRLNPGMVDINGNKYYYNVYKYYYTNHSKIYEFYDKIKHLDTIMEDINKIGYELYKVIRNNNIRYYARPVIPMIFRTNLFTYWFGEQDNNLAINYIFNNHRGVFLFFINEYFEIKIVKRDDLNKLYNEKYWRDIVTETIDLINDLTL